MCSPRTKNVLFTANNKEIFTKIDKIMKAKWREVNLNLRLYCMSVGVVAITYSIVPAVINLVNLFQGNDIPKRFGKVLNIFWSEFKVLVTIWIITVYKTYYRYLEEAKYQSPLHELLFCSESLSGFTTWAGVVSFDGLYVLLTMHLVTMFSSLNLIIKEASNVDFNDAEKQFFLHECIKHHTRALKFVKAGGDAWTSVDFCFV